MTKYVFLKKMQIKTYPDNATDNSLKYKVSIIWIAMQFQILSFLWLL